MTLLRAALVMIVSAPAMAWAAELPDAIAVKGGTVVVQAHAVGAQVYECKVSPSNTLAWQFREPIATLMVDGKTVGRHYAGPTWDIGGSAIVGKVAGQSPGASPSDIAWLKLNVAEHKGEGPLKDVITVQRINTKGGNAQGACETAGELRSEPYSADYVFFKG